jgi:hypothetical protein
MQRAGMDGLVPETREVEPPDEAIEARIRDAWTTLIPRAEAIADGISLTLFEKDREWYDKAPTKLRADVRHSTREHIRRGILAMAGRADPEQRTTDVWRETGRRRARQGVPMELVLNAYSLGTRVLWEALLDLGSREDLDIDDHVLLVAGQQLWHSLDVQNAVLVDAYRRESARLVRRDLQRQQGYLDGLVEGRGADPHFAKEAAAALGVGVDEPVACVAAPLDESLDEPLRAPEDRLERAGRASYWHVRGGTSFGLVPAGGLARQDLVELLRPVAAGRVGVVVSPEGISGFATAYQLAARAALTLPRGRNEVVTVNDRLPEVLLSASPEVSTLLVEETVGPLLSQSAHQSEVLVTTLAALIHHNGSPTRAAEALFCHRNTVIYRLKQIEQLTGRDLQVPRDRLLLGLGLMAAGRSISDNGALA